jgi:hypothetical protein
MPTVQLAQRRLDCKKFVTILSTNHFLTRGLGIFCLAPQKNSGRDRMVVGITTTYAISAYNQ